MNIEILFAFRTLKHANAGATETTFENQKFIKNRWRKQIYETLETSRISRTIFIIAVVYLFIKRIFRIRFSFKNDDNICALFCTTNQERQIQFLQNNVLSNQRVSFINLKDGNCINLNLIKYFFWRL